MFRKILVYRFYRIFRLKILSFGKKCDEVVQMKIRGIRKAIFCKILTYSERAESQLSPKVLLTTICDLHLLLRVPDSKVGEIGVYLTASSGLINYYIIIIIIIYCLFYIFFYAFNA